jgi:hypothetical protein
MDGREQIRSSDVRCEIGNSKSKLVFKYAIVLVGCFSKGIYERCIVSK